MVLWILCCVPLYYSKCPGRSCVLGLYFRSLPTGATRRGSLLVLLDVLGEACVAASLVRVANEAALVHGTLPNRARTSFLRHLHSVNSITMAAPATRY